MVPAKWTYLAGSRNERRAATRMTGNRSVKLCRSRTKYTVLVLGRLTVGALLPYGCAVVGGPSWRSSTDDIFQRPLWWRTDARRDLARLDEIFR
jgi:hypothetical protein